MSNPIINFSWHPKCANEAPHEPNGRTLSSNSSPHG